MSTPQISNAHHKLALHLMLVDSLWERSGLGMEELRITLKQFVGRRGLSLQLLEPLRVPPLDGIFRRGSSLIGLRSEVWVKNPGLRRNSISLGTLVHGQSGAIIMNQTIAKADGFPWRVTCHYDENHDRLFVLYEGNIYQSHHFCAVPRRWIHPNSKPNMEWK
ncbi:hypothetical protein FOZ63_028565 [Perkinsus olseni]|uniref:Uncharacterized protein n=2 Tax=Perkinsus olseni TaxID=32597 RepID=A0A7J6TYH2_PEROL|nr:hypothetical protein FOZ63_028565 [Perkinsus olseni]